MVFVIVFSLLYFMFPYIAYREMRYGRSLEPDAPDSSLPYEKKEHVTHGVIRRQGRTLMTWSLIAAGIAFISILPLMGIPGGFLLEFYRSTGLTARAMDVDKVWPAAIYASVLWPIAIPAGVYLRQKLQRHRPDRSYYWAPPVVVLVWLVLVGVILRLAVGG